MRPVARTRNLVSACLRSFDGLRSRWACRFSTRSQSQLNKRSRIWDHLGLPPVVGLQFLHGSLAGIVPVSGHFLQVSSFYQGRLNFGCACVVHGAWFGSTRLAAVGCLRMFSVLLLGGCSSPVQVRGIRAHRGQEKGKHEHGSTALLHKHFLFCTIASRDSLGVHTVTVSNFDGRGKQLPPAKRQGQPMGFGCPCMSFHVTGDVRPPGSKHPSTGLTGQQTPRHHRT